MTGLGTAPDPVAAADAVVAAVDPGLDSPGVEARDVVLVTGPWLAGATSVLAALRERLPQQTFVESTELVAGEAPAAVVFVVSAAAPLTESDCELLDLASRYTDLVIGVLSKIDAHRDWRHVRDADAEILAVRAPRYGQLPWVGVAAAPDLGEPQLDDLVELLAERLAARAVVRRNRLRAWEARLEAVIGRYEADGAGADRKARVDALRRHRDEVNRTRRLAKTERSIALRSQLQQARVQLGYFARNRCNSVRTELQEDVAAITRRRIAAFERYARQRTDDVVGEVDEGITEHLGDVAAELGLAAPPAPGPPPRPELSSPPLKSRTTETRLMMVLGVGFGLGVALAVSRLLAGAAPRLAVAGLVIGAVVGLLLTVWVVSIRGLLHDAPPAPALLSITHHDAAVRRRGTRGHPDAGRRDRTHHRHGCARGDRGRNGRRADRGDRRRVARTCDRDGPRGHPAGPSDTAVAACVGGGPGRPLRQSGRQSGRYW